MLLMQSLGEDEGSLWKVAFLRGSGFTTVPGMVVAVKEISRGGVVVVVGGVGVCSSVGDVVKFGFNFFLTRSTGSFVENICGFVNTGPSLIGRFLEGKDE